MSSYKLSRKAQNDLIDIWKYTKYRWSRNQANKYLSILLEKIDYISINKDIGKKCDYIRLGYYRFPIESHVVFYKAQEESAIEIIRILRKSADIESKF